MIERTIPKDKWPLDRLKKFLVQHPDWEYVVNEYPIAWHIKIDRGGENLDDELREYEIYPDPRLAYLVEVSQIDAKMGQVKVRRGSHERSLNCLTSKTKGDKAVLIFLEGDRAKPVIVG